MWSLEQVLWKLLTSWVTLNKSLPVSGSPPSPTTLAHCRSQELCWREPKARPFLNSLSVFVLSSPSVWKFWWPCPLYLPQSHGVWHFVATLCVSLTGLQETRGLGWTFTFVISIARQIYNEKLTGREYPTKIMVREWAICYSVCFFIFSIKKKSWVGITSRIREEKL